MSAGQRRAAFRDNCFIALGESADEFMTVGKPGGLNNLFIAGIGVPKRDVLAIVPLNSSAS
jgi:hypothetical protein